MGKPLGLRGEIQAMRKTARPLYSLSFCTYGPWGRSASTRLESTETSGMEGLSVRF